VDSKAKLIKKYEEGVLRFPIYANVGFSISKHGDNHVITFWSPNNDEICSSHETIINAINVLRDDYLATINAKTLEHYQDLD